MASILFWYPCVMGLRCECQDGGLSSYFPVAPISAPSPPAPDNTAKLGTLYCEGQGTLMSPVLQQKQLI